MAAASKGLQVRRPSIATACRSRAELLRQHPNLTYAVLMPWIKGPTWTEVLLDKRSLSPDESLLLARSLAEVLATMR